jgi:NADH-quinone oxidoreductase subunit E
MSVLTPERRDEAERIKARYPDGRERSAVLPLLYLVQSVEGRVTREGLGEVAALLGLTTAEVEAVATFYTMLRLRPTGKHLISVCTNLSCAVLGARELYAAAKRELGPACEDATEDGLFSLHEEECLAACDAAPLVQVDLANHDRCTRERLLGMIEQLRAGEVPAPSRGEAPQDFRAASRILAGLPGPGDEGGATT